MLLNRRLLTRLGALLVVLLLGLSACGSDGTPAADPGSGDDATDGGDEETAADGGGGEETAADGGDDAGGDTASGDSVYDDVVPLTLTVGPVPPSMTALALGVAFEEGLFEKYGLDIDFRNVDSGVTVFRGLEGRLADIGLTSIVVQTNAMAAGEGANVRMLYGATQYFQHQLLTRVGEVDSCEDLEGKVLSIDQVGGILEMLNRHFLSTCGLTPEDVTYATLSSNPAALIENQADTVTTQPERIKQVELDFPDEEFHTITNFWESVPLMWGHGWASTVDMLEQPEKREGLIRFTQAMIEANEFMNDTANRERVIEITNTFTGTSSPEAAGHGYDIYQESGLWPASGEHGIKQEQVDWTVDFSVEVGNITADVAPSYEDLVDLSVWEEAQSRYESQQ